MRATPVFVLWVVFGGLALGVRVRKHFLVNVPMTWKDARSYCRQYYNDLSTIITDSENHILNVNLLLSSAENAWIGLHRCHPQSAETCITSPWEWSDGDVSTYSDWDYGEPNSEANSESCVELWYLTGEWNDQNCYNTNAFFCFKWSGEIILVTERMSWEEALLYCREKYTDLASLLTDTDMALADEKASNAQTAQVWTSLRFLAGEWLWVSETQEADQKFTQGNLSSCPAHPYSCGARSRDGDRWENQDCQEKLNFLCYRA